jgi:hypothetical protein
MKVAWLTHHLPGENNASWALPGNFAGGAEMCDAAMIEQKPDGIEVDLLPPDKWEQALSYDRLVITGTDQLTDKALLALSEVKPLVWVHHAQAQTADRAVLFQRADPFVCMSALHAELEGKWTGTSPQWNHGFINPRGIHPGPKDDHALWAARNHPQKGLMQARIWALNNDIPLVELTNQPRESVLDAMSVARWFVFLPKGFDACPRTLIEAELAGCEIVTNGLAGRRDPGDIREVLQRQINKFWNWL